MNRFSSKDVTKQELDRHEVVFKPYILIFMSPKSSLMSLEQNPI